MTISLDRLQLKKPSQLNPLLNTNVAYESMNVVLRCPVILCLFVIPDWLGHGAGCTSSSLVVYTKMQYGYYSQKQTYFGNQF